MTRRAPRRDPWRQTFPNTCGPAALAEVLTRLGWRAKGDRVATELGLWRESTAVACPGAHPYGLALAARRRAVVAEVQIDGRRPWLWKHIEREHAGFPLAAYRRVERQLALECARARVPIHRSARPPQGLAHGLLLSEDHDPRTGDRDPHWLAVVPSSGGVRLIDPLSRARTTTAQPLAELWARSGFEGTRTWLRLSRRGPRGRAPSRSASLRPRRGRPSPRATTTRRSRS